MSISIRAACLCLFLGLAAGCVSERVEPPDDGKVFLKKEMEKVVKRLPFQTGLAFYQDLNRLVAFGDFAKEPMQECLTDSNPKMRAAGAYVLGQLKVTEVVPDLIELTRDENKQVRLEASRAVLEIGAWDTIPVLIQGLEDENKSVRYLCFDVLNRKTGEDFGFKYDAPEPERTKAVLKWKQWWGSVERDPCVSNNLASR